MKHRKKAVVICRCGALGDVICTLPMVGEARRRHPNRLLVFVTAAGYREMVVLSQAADLVYSRKNWNWGFSLPANLKELGMVDGIYNPTTTDERLKHSGPAAHLIDDLASSCGFVLSERQPRLYPNSTLVQKSRLAHGLTEEKISHKLLIGINGGPSWPVKNWEVFKWQELINKIHATYEAVILQFGSNNGDGTSEYDNLTGVQSVAGRLKSEEIVALIAACDLMVSIDSGPVHVAGAVGTPVIGLFGSNAASYRLPPSSPGMGLAGKVSCLACHHTTPRSHWHTGCTKDIKCMKELEVETVFNAVESMLANKGNEHNSLKRNQAPAFATGN